MIISLASKRPVPSPSLPPADFYRFRHTTEVVEASGVCKAVSRPLWIVGNSPFDPSTSSDEGYVVHLGNPQFVARWTISEETIAQVKQPDYVDEELNLVLYEVSPTGAARTIEPEWLLEAVCAVAYSKGMIAVLPHDETH